MTKITKHFVGLGDLAALRVICDHCGASLSLPIMSNAFRLPENCPSCRYDWYQNYGNGSNIGNIALRLVQDMKALRNVLELETKANTNIHVSLDVEVNALDAAPFSSNRDA